MVTIDGSTKSGSGTIVRDAVPFAALQGVELHLTNIRNKRIKPGLRAQHLHGVQAACTITAGHLQGAEIGSHTITFMPGTALKSGSFNWDIGTAGSTTMLALSVIPLGLFGDTPSTYMITGGLFQDFAPSAYHVLHVLLPLLRRMGADITLSIIRPGYVPKGHGMIRIDVAPRRTPLVPLSLTHRGTVTDIRGTALSSHLKDRSVSHRMAEECARTLAAQGYIPHIENIYDTRKAPAFRSASIQPGAVLTAWALTDTGCVLGADMAGARGRPAEFIGTRVARKLLATLQTDATVDEHIADQLIPFAALAEGWSTYIIPRMTEHIDTRLWLARTILGARTEVRDNIIRIKGIGYCK